MIKTWCQKQWAFFFWTNVFCTKCHRYWAPTLRAGRVLHQAGKLLTSVEFHVGMVLDWASFSVSTALCFLITINMLSSFLLCVILREEEYSSPLWEFKIIPSVYRSSSVCHTVLSLKSCSLLPSHADLAFNLATLKVLGKISSTVYHHIHPSTSQKVQNVTNIKNTHT